MVNLLSFKSLLFSFLFLAVFLVPGLMLAAPAAAPELPDLYLADAKGEVYVVHNEFKEKADPPQVLEAGDRILTRAGSFAYLEFRDGGVVEVGPSSDFKVSLASVQPDSLRARFLLAYGKTIAMVKKLTTASSVFEIEAGGVISGVRGTIFGVEYDGYHCQVKERTYEGSVSNRWGFQGRQKIVNKGERGTFCVYEEGSVDSLTSDDNKDFSRFRNAVDSLGSKRSQRLNQLKTKMAEEAAAKASSQRMMFFLAIAHVHY